MIWSIFLKAILHRIYLAHYENFVSFVLFGWIAFQELLRIFNFFLIALTFGHCQENSQANRKLITAFSLHLWPKVQQEPYNKVASLQTVGRPVKFEKTIFWFCCNALFYWATLTTSIITVNYFYEPPHSIKHVSLWL